MLEHLRHYNYQTLKGREIPTYQRNLQTHPLRITKVAWCIKFGKVGCNPIDTLTHFTTPLSIHSSQTKQHRQAPWTSYLRPNTFVDDLVWQPHDLITRMVTIKRLETTPTNPPNITHKLKQKISYTSKLSISLCRDMFAQIGRIYLRSLVWRRVLEDCSH